MSLEQKMSALGRTIGEREAQHADSLARAREKANQLRARVAQAIDAFQDAATEAGAPQLRLDVSEPRIDDKHLRAVEFELRRGRHTAIITVKSRGDVTLVGPFRQGKNEGPCRSFPLDADADIDDALIDFLGAFVEEASSP